MKDLRKSKAQLIEELNALRQRIGEDTIERNGAEEASRHSEDKFYKAFHNSPDAITITKASDGLLVEVNVSFERISGYTREEVIGHTPVALNFWTNNQDRDRYFLTLREKGNVTDFETTFRTKSGEIRNFVVSGEIYEVSGEEYLINIIRDITERKNAEKALLENEDRYRDLVENIQDLICTHDMEGRILSVNQAAVKLLGIDLNQILKRNLRDILAPEVKDQFEEYLDRLKRDGKAKGLMKVQTLSGKKQIWEYDNTLRTEGVDQPVVRAMVRDITERKLAERALRESEEKYRLLVENAGEAIYVAQAGMLKFVNQTSSKLTGYTREELTSRPFIEFVHPDDRELVLDRHIKRQEGMDLPHIYSFRIITKSGDTRWVNLNVVQIEWEGKPATLNFMVDITSRKQAEESLRLSEEKLSKAFRASPDWITISTLDEGRIIDVNDAFIKDSGFSREELTGHTSTLIGLWVDAQDRDRGVEILIKEGSLKNFETKVRFKSGEVRTMLLSSEVIRLEGQSCIISILRDITELRMAQNKLTHTLENLRLALGGTVHALALASETRDPYTAGHQKRVSDLARAIAHEMGIPEERVDGLRMAGVIHDLGKISIPAEILSKPTKLSDIEFGLIKTHSQIGYDVLKDVDFPWPIARMVLEHHERINGSGYPQGLTGDKLLLESKILMVADVVEAIASNRPYRPAYGIDVALDEIEKNKGILYDSEAVEACLRLFREKGFSLK